MQVDTCMPLVSPEVEAFEILNSVHRHEFLLDCMNCLEALVEFMATEAGQSHKLAQVSYMVWFGSSPGG